MTVTGEQARALRLRRHHLDRPLPSGGLVEAAAGCGVQNSPPGAWETALWDRVEGVTLPPVPQGGLPSPGGRVLHAAASGGPYQPSGGERPVQVVAAQAEGPGLFPGDGHGAVSPGAGAS